MTDDQDYGWVQVYPPPSKLIQHGARGMSSKDATVVMPLGRALHITVHTRDDDVTGFVVHRSTNTNTSGLGRPCGHTSIFRSNRSHKAQASTFSASIFALHAMTSARRTTLAVDSRPFSGHRHSLGVVGCDLRTGHALGDVFG